MISPFAIQKPNQRFNPLIQNNEESFRSFLLYSNFDSKLPKPKIFFKICYRMKSQNVLCGSYSSLGIWEKWNRGKVDEEMWMNEKVSSGKMLRDNKT